MEPPAPVSGPHAGAQLGHQQKTSSELHHERLHRSRCYDHLLIAPLWVAYEANFGTLARTTDAVGACLVLPRSKAAKTALSRGDPGRFRPHVHWVNSSHQWVAEQAARKDTHILGVELADGAIRLGDLPPARQRTVVLLGHEHGGLPEEVWSLLEDVVEIPMIGLGASLNVAVAGSLVLYRLAGLS